MEKIIVTIGAGHGGIDGGALGPSGLKEKDCTLAIAQKTAELLNENGGAEAVLLRDGDHYLSLPERGRTAARLKSQCHVEIHAGNVGEAAASVIRSVHLPGDERAAVEMAQGIAGALQVKNAGSRTRQGLEHPDDDFHTVMYTAVRGGVPHVFLAECGCIKDAEAEKRLRDDSTLKAIAAAIARPVIRLLGQEPVQQETEMPQKTQDKTQEAPAVILTPRDEDISARDRVETVALGIYFVREKPSFCARVTGSVKGGDRFETQPAEMGFRRIYYRGGVGYVGPGAWNSPAGDGKTEPAEGR